MVKNKLIIFRDDFYRVIDGRHDIITDNDYDKTCENLLERTIAGIKPDQRQDQRADTKKKHNDRGCFEIPFRLRFFDKELPAKTAFNSFILNFLGAK